MRRSVAAAAVALAAACARPAPEQPAASLPPVCDGAEADHELDRCAGWVLDQVLREALPIYDDPGLAAYVTRVGHRLTASLGSDELAWTFRVIDHDDVLAYAMIGGYVYVSRGALARLGSEAELAALLAHEIGHVVAGHGADSFRALAGDEGIEDRDLYRRFLRERDEERQADELAVRYVAVAGYDPGAVHTMLARVHEGSEDAGAGDPRPSWQRSHPPARVRIARVARAAHGLGGGYVGRDRYRERLRAAQLIEPARAMGVESAGDDR